MSTRVRHRRGGWILPVLLLVSGIVALLANVGAITWDQVNRLGDLWPLVLILFGMYLILGVTVTPRTRDLVIALLVIVAAAGAVAYIAAGPAGGELSSASAPLGEASTGEVDITGGAATVHLHVGDTGQDLYRASFRTGFGAHPEVTNASGKVAINFDSSRGFVSFRRDADITLSQQVPWTISVDGGAMTVDGDLSAGKLTRLDVGGGANHVDLKLPAPLGDTPLTFSGGALDVRLHRPAGSQVRATVSGGASTIVGDDRRVTSLGGDAAWETAGWGGAPDRYTVDVSGGANTVRVDTYAAA
jgi:hypothetical protein